MRTTIFILLVVAAVATLGSAAPGKNGKAAQAGGRRKPTGQPMSTTAAPAGTNATRLNRLTRLRREAGDEETVVPEQPLTSTRKPQQSRRNGHGKGKGKNSTVKAGGKRHQGNRTQRDLSSMLSQASSLFGSSAAAAGAKQPDLNTLMSQAQNMLNSLGSQSQAQLNSMLQGAGISQSDISALISQGSSMLSSLGSSSSNGLLANLTAQFQQMAAPLGRKRREASTFVEEEEEEFRAGVEIEESYNSTSEYIEDQDFLGNSTSEYIDDHQDFLAAAEQASNVVAVMQPVNGTMPGKKWGGSHLNRFAGAFELTRPLLRGDWRTFLVNVQDFLAPYLNMAMRFLGPLLGMAFMNDSIGIF